MANLRGGNHEKQIKDATHRMGRLGQKKRDDEGKNAHSVKVQNDRVAMLRDFAKTVPIETKLNEAMTSENVQKFLETRLEGLKGSTQETYARGFSAMIESLQSNNISVTVEKEIFNNFVHEAKANDTSSVEIYRSISHEDFQTLQANLSSRHEMSGVIAEVQYQMGYRISEAVEIVKNIQNHLKNGNLEKVYGKGGREYSEKAISPELIQKIEALENQIGKSTYDKDLRAEGVKSHNLRISFAKNEYEKEINQGIAHHESMKETSNELGHSRPYMTQYYLNRA